MPHTAVVILNHNGQKYLETFLPKAIQYTPQAEIIVADNASTDHSIEFLSKNFPEVKLIKFASNYGFSLGYNIALKQISAKYFVLLNSDVEVTPNWLVPILDFMEKHPDCAACQPKILSFKDKECFEYSGASGGYLDYFGYPFCRGRIFDTIEKDHGQYDDIQKIFWASGACLMIRSEVYFQVGGLDKDFFAHMEEIDLCWRIHTIGLQINVIPSSVVYHIGSGTLLRSNPFKSYLNFRNGLYLLLKNLPLSKLIFKLPIRIILDWMAVIKFLIEKKPEHSLAVIRAHLYVTRKIVHTLKKRDKVSDVKHKRILVYEYYIKKNKKFANLF